MKKPLAYGNISVPQDATEVIKAYTSTWENQT